MKVSIYGENKVMGLAERYDGVDMSIVTIKETHKRNGRTVTDVRIARGKRDIVLSDGMYKTLTVQDEETGRYLLKISR